MGVYEIALGVALGMVAYNVFLGAAFMVFNTVMIIVRYLRGEV